MTDQGMLATIDPMTGLATPVTGTHVGVPNLGAFEISSAGVFYAVSWATNSLYTINPTTGLPTLVGPLGFNDVRELAFDPSGTLWAINKRSLYTINTLTGAGTKVVNLPNITGIDGYYSLAFDGSGNAFTAAWMPNSPLYSINIAAASVSPIGGTTNYPQGMDIAVPEPGTLALLGLGLAGLAATRRRKQ